MAFDQEVFDRRKVSRLNCAHSVRYENITIIEGKVEYEVVEW